MRDLRAAICLGTSLFLTATVWLLPACAAPSGGTSSRDPIDSTSLGVVEPMDSIISDRPWTYYGIEGRMIETASYRIFLTERDPLISRRVPVFLELALAHYRTMLGELPRPGGAMETYILASRSQWAALTRQLMGSRADTYLKIRAGGFASQGRAMLFNIGARGTFATTSHEGWHQYTQRTFRQPLPIWLEEGIATLMEGYRWDEVSPDRPIFLPWANVDRFSRLRDLVNDRRQFSLTELLTQRPQDLLNVVDNERALDYYSQVWALVHFLREGEGRRYRAALSELVQDASGGFLFGKVRMNSSQLDYAEMLRRRAGSAVFRVYFNDDLDEASREYDEFLRVITATGARDRIVAGRSPLR